MTNGETLILAAAFGGWFWGRYGCEGALPTIASGVAYLFLVALAMWIFGNPLASLGTP